LIKDGNQRFGIGWDSSAADDRHLERVRRCAPATGRAIANGPAAGVLEENGPALGRSRSLQGIFESS